MQSKDLEYEILPCQNVPEFLKERHRKAYLMWKKVWHDAYQENGQQVKVVSERFTRNAETGALFYKGDCVALTCFRPVDFREPSTREDSYFDAWSDDCIDGLTKNGPHVLACNNLTVSEKYRGEIVPGVQLKVLISQLSSLHLLETGYPVMTGAMRTAKGAHKAAALAGATLIGQGVDPFGWELDLMGFFEETIRPKTTVFHSAWAIEIFERHKDYTNIRAPKEYTTTPTNVAA